MRHTYPLLSSLEEIEALLRQRFEESFLTLKDLPDPYRFKDMQRAVERIVRALQQNEKIVLIGDYDVDGVSATAIMRRFFEVIDHPLEWVIPNRFRDGYGLSPTLMPRVEHADLILTVDNGISATEAAKLWREKGIDLIITDHHIVPEQAPEAYAIVDQKQKECSFPHEEVCGAQIAWYLCAALNRRLDAGVQMKALLELTALAIIADIMPLQHINRPMVQAGLKLLERSESPFIRAWRESREQESIRAEDIAFGLAPLLNSAGRVEDASVACEYLCASNIYEARTLLARLGEYNERRKSLEQEITEEAMEQVRREDPVLVLAAEAWHEGVLGIVAARIARRFERPAILLTRTEEGYKGSGRSFGDCHLFDLVSTHRNLLERFGGHAAAVGLSLRGENLQAFRESLIEVAGEKCPGEPFRDPAIAGEIDPGLIGWELYRLLEAYEPYGEGNPRPKFIARGVEILEHRSLGQEKNHQKYLFAAGERTIEGIEFHTREALPTGSEADLLFTLGSNSFRGNTTLQLLIEKMLPSQKADR